MGTQTVMTRCSATGCKHPATVVAHLVQGPHAYCTPHGEWMRQVYGVLGTHLHVVPLPSDPPAGSTRMIDL